MESSGCNWMVYFLASLLLNNPEPVCGSKLPSVKIMPSAILPMIIGIGLQIALFTQTAKSQWMVKPKKGFVVEPLMVRYSTLTRNITVRFLDRKSKVIGISANGWYLFEICYHLGCKWVHLPLIENDMRRALRLEVVSVSADFFVREWRDRFFFVFFFCFFVFLWQVWFWVLRTQF